MSINVKLERGVIGLANHVSVALLQKSVYNSDLLYVFKRWFNRGFTCPPIKVTDTQPVQATSMLGLFISFGAFAGAALVVAVGKRVRGQARLRQTSGKTAGGEEDKSR